MMATLQRNVGTRHSVPPLQQTWTPGQVAVSSPVPPGPPVSGTVAKAIVLLNVCR